MKRKFTILHNEFLATIDDSLSHGTACVNSIDYKANQQADIHLSRWLSYSIVEHIQVATIFVE